MSLYIGLINVPLFIDNEKINVRVILLGRYAIFLKSHDMFRIIRIVSSISVTALAYLGVKTDFKIDGELSSTGNIVIFIAVLLVVTSIVLEILEYLRQKRHRKEVNEKFEDIKFQLSKPMLPFNLRYVLKYTTKEELIENTFGEQISSMKSIIDLFKNQGKFIHPGLTDNFPWDENHQINEYVLCKIEKDELHNLIEQNNKILKLPYSGNIEIYKKNSNQADLVLKMGSLSNDNMPYTSTDLRLYNKNIYLENYIHQWSIKENKDTILSIYDLRGSKLKLKLDFTTYDEKDHIDAMPYLTFLQFKCGERPYNLIHFDHNFLKKPIIIKGNINSINGHAKKHFPNNWTMEYDLQLPDENFENYIEQYN